METRSNYVMVGAVTLAMIAGLLLFTVWLAGLSNKTTKCYDIYFAQGVSGAGDRLQSSSAPCPRQSSRCPSEATRSISHLTFAGRLHDASNR